MFEYLKDYDYIFVTGMQRSGTTICMRMIQWDLEIKQCVWVGKDPFKITEIHTKAHLKCPILFHCTGVPHLAHKYGKNKNCAVVWMRRNTEDLLLSLSNFRTIENSVVKDFYYREKDLAIYNLDSTATFEDVLRKKTARWEFFQKPIIENGFEVEYESLKDHPLWLDYDYRAGFNSRQTSLNSPADGAATGKALDFGDLESLLKEFPKSDPSD